MKKLKKTAIVLLSGGLDSVVSIAVSDYDIKFGLLFDYGQKSFLQEKKSASKIAEFYGFPLKIVKLDWLKEILKNGLTDVETLHRIEDFEDVSQLEKSMKSVWVPNRNALFLNISASYCEVFGIDLVLIGANKEEGVVFKDNSKSFIEACNNLFETSTNSCVEVSAPLIDMSKNDIVKTAIKLNVPLQYIYSCYVGEEKHCGICESCLHLKQALLKNKKEDLIKKLF